MLKGIKFVFKLLSALVATGLVAGALVIAAVIYFNSPPKASPNDANTAGLEGNPVLEDTKIEGDRLYLEVKRGESADSVGRRLEDMKVIKNRYFWSLLFRIDKNFLKTGSYVIELPATQMKIRSILTAGEQILVKVTIPEGVTLKKTARILEEAGICEAEEFLAAARSPDILEAYNISGSSVEGYIYPDTYLFPRSYPASRVIQVMADNLFKHLEEISKETYTSSELRERIIIASIVEREYRVREEAAVMAGVFYNRMDIGMALQSCATVEYIITEIQGKPHPKQLFNRDLEIADPYNTYLRPGLPPGPISAPGETALRAAFYPEPSNFFYFRLTDESLGKHYFSRTLDDHIRAGALYVKGD